MRHRDVRPLVVVTLVLAVSACQRVPPHPLDAARTAASLEARTLDDPGLARFLTAAWGEPLPTRPLRTWDVDGLTLAALYFQPSLAAARAHAALAGGAVRTAGALPNPTLSVTPEYGVNPMGAVSPWIAAVHLDWTIETAGKRGWRVARATAEAEAARAAITIEAWRIRRTLVSALIALGEARGRAAGLAEELAAVEHAATLAEGRRAAGAASTVEVAPLRLAALQAAVERAAADAQLDEATARVAAAIGVPVRALDGLTLPTQPDAETLRVLAELAPADARRRALLARADVRQGLAAYGASEAVLGLELARQYPDVHLGPGYQYDQGQNKWSIGLAVDLPLLNRNEGPIAEAVAARDEAAARVLAAQAAAIADVEQALARRAGAALRRERLGRVLADRNANLRRSRTGLAAGALDRAALVAAEVERARAARAAGEADAAYAQALVDLEAAVEGPIPDLPDPSALPALAAEAP